MFMPFKLLLTLKFLKRSEISFSSFVILAKKIELDNTESIDYEALLITKTLV